MKISNLVYQPSTICSIDASTNNFAFAIFTDKKLVSHGKINFVGNTIFEKIRDAARKTGPVFNQFSIDAIIIEHTVYINSPKTMADLAMIQGALLGSAMRGGVKKVGSINPITWQTFIKNGKLTTEERKAIKDSNPGKSSAWYKTKEREIRKERTIKFVNTYFDLSVTDNDVADAIGIGYYAINNWEKVGG